MKRYVRYDPFNVLCFESSQWEHPVHKHTYHEIIYIRNGSGRHIINENEFTYSDGDVFLLGPEDYHYFNIQSSTGFIYIRFTESYIKENTTSQNHWFHVMESMLASASRSNGSIIKDKQEQHLFHQVLISLVQEYESRQNTFNEVIMQHLLKVLLSILARNFRKHTSLLTKQDKHPELIENMLSYITAHIHQPELLKIEALADTFHYSSTYISTLFKKKVGQSLQQYILRYKLSLIENRLNNSSMTLSEISREFGFTDESHFNKVFRKQYGISPGAYRKQAQ